MTTRHPKGCPAEADRRHRGAARTGARGARLAVLGALVVAVALVGAGCGDDGGRQRSSPPGPSTTLATPPGTGGPTIGSGGAANGGPVVSVPQPWGGPDPGEVPRPDLAGIAYGPEPEQLLDVHRPPPGVAPRGTIVRVHGGAWIEGSRQGDQPGRRLLMAQRTQGWAVVSIDYRLAPRRPGGGPRAAELVADVDRAVRVVRARAGELGLDVEPLVVAGGSAGGHLALLHALGAGGDPALPADLAAVSPTVDAVVAVVAPAELASQWTTGGIAPVGVESLLGCTPAEEAALEGMAPCPPEEVDRWSPLRLAGRGGALVPAYLAYGGADALVPAEAQGRRLAERWAAAAAPGTVWFDVASGGTHDLDREANVAAVGEFLGRVESGGWG